MPDDMDEERAVDCHPREIVVNPSTHDMVAIIVHNERDKDSFMALGECLVRGFFSFSIHQS